jgi:hypothetical protein
MRDRRMRIRGVLAGLALSAAIGLAPAQAAVGALKIKPYAAGLSYESLGRTVVWKGDAASSKIQASLISARAEFGFGKGILVGLSAGLVLTDFKGLTFTSLPISLQFDAPPLKGFFLGAEAVAPVLKFSDFEISGTGRFVYSFGMSKTWPIEDFAVAGQAVGRSSWTEAALGPRISYLFFGRIVPYVEVSVRWLGAEFGMTETLSDLVGKETKRVRGDFSFSAVLGADFSATDRIAVRARAGILPFAGGIDSLLSVGVLYKF